MIAANGRHTRSERQPSARAAERRAPSLPTRTTRKTMIARPAMVASERRARTFLNGATAVPADCIGSFTELHIWRRPGRRGSEAHVHLADDEPGVADVDPVVVPI